ncbi:SUMF1/EgtB/PvdO family nonheme iron enzyme [Nocardia takedensis]
MGVLLYDAGQRVPVRVRARSRADADSGYHDGRDVLPIGYGRSDMTGDVWEWTADCFRTERAVSSCCIPGVPEGARECRSRMSVSPGGWARVVRICASPTAGCGIGLRRASKLGRGHRHLSPGVPVRGTGSVVTVRWCQVMEAGPARRVRRSVGAVRRSWRGWRG